jgi:hypothetical protein
LVQSVREHEIAHVVERKSPLEPLRGEQAPPEHAARIVDEDIDPRLGRADLGPEPLHIGDQRQVAVMNAVRRLRADLAQPGQRLLRPSAVARNHDDARALPCELLRSDPADARRGASDDDDFVANGTLPGYCRAGTLPAKSIRHAVVIAAPTPL